MLSIRSFNLSPVDNDRLANLLGQFNEHIRQIESRLGVQISQRGFDFSVEGAPEAAARAQLVIEGLYEAAASRPLSPDTVHLHLQEAALSLIRESGDLPVEEIVTRKLTVQCRGRHQIDYVNSIRARDLTFGIGPAGTGKTYLAVACAVEALEAETVRRLVLVRPAVEAGERLGFLPGDLAQKVDPYLRPIYDALYEFLGFDRVAKLIERNVIEVAPLAYMRGRTLNHACVIMDEAQNTTVEQMKMFLTRIGYGSKAIVTGDITQVDLPNKSKSGLRHVEAILKNVEGLAFCHFAAADVVRHPLVQRIVAAYDQAENTPQEDN
ncbi:PhoH family protein [Granulosicoccaceae sp. 1_MG-2023]|nr:PhoH family protein [Granulosicoccaceae sp. 1_MG-2023]